MPLNSDHEVFGGFKLHGFDDVIGRRDGGDEEIVTKASNGLMVAGVARILVRSQTSTEPAQARFGSDLERMCVCDIAAGPVVDLRVQYGLKILDQ